MPDEDFSPITPNPFIVGNPVRQRRMFFGREAEFQLIQKRFRDSDVGGIIVLCGERRSGKTSILFQILQGRLGPTFLPVLVDMQSMAVHSEAEFYRKITSEIIQSLHADEGSIEIPVFRDDRRAPQLFQEFVSLLVSKFPDRKPILLIDEYELLESKIESGVLGPDVLHVFASLLERHAFFLVFTGSLNLEERKRSYWRILGQSIHRRISYLEKSDATDLITKPVAGQVDYGEGTVELLYRLGAGHPFYTQALCQSLVDQLNEHRTRRVSKKLIADVVAGIIRNPFPQMLFLWQGLSRNEKLALALLAEGLRDADTFARPEDLMQVLKDKGYPPAIDRAQLAAALEELFQKELLVKHADVHRGFAYRMDLWRQWILREHSGWQVIREEGIAETAKSRSAWRRRALWTAGPAIILIAAAVSSQFLRQRQSEPELPLLPAPATLSLEPMPREAFVRIDGEDLGAGPVLRQLEPDERHEIALRAPGYADTSFQITLAAGESIRREVVLQPLLGAAHIMTEPATSALYIDGVHRGISPLTVDSLTTNREHTVRAELSGYLTHSLSFAVSPQETLTYTLKLEPTLFDVLVSTTPPGADLRVNGRPRGVAPTTIRGLRSGTYRVSASLQGYETLDSLLAIDETTAPIHLLLKENPPGVLVVRGNLLARRIYIDKLLYVENVHNSGPCTLSTGSHLVEVEYSDTTVSRLVDVKPRGRVTYDFVQGEIQ